MNRFVAKIVVLFWSLVLLSGCASTNPDEPTPPPYDEKNPVLAMVGEFPIDQEYFEANLRLIPDEQFEIYSHPKQNRRFLHDLVVQEIFYQEGLREKRDEDKTYTNNVDKATRIALVDYALEKEVAENNPIDDAQIRARYDANPAEFAGAGSRAPAFFEVREKIRRRMLKERMDLQMAAVAPTLEERFSVRYFPDPLKIGNENSNKPVVESGIVTWTPADFALKAEEAGLKDQLKDFEGRVKVLNRLVNELLFYDNAIADQIDQEPQFQVRLEAIRHYLLSIQTQKLIIGNDVKATLAEARAYYDLHPEVFFDGQGAQSPFSDVREKALEKATEDKRKKVLAQLAKALSRDRFRGVVFKENCDRLWGAAEEE